MKGEFDFRSHYYKTGIKHSLHGAINGHFHIQCKTFTYFSDMCFGSRLPLVLDNPGLQKYLCIIKPRFHKDKKVPLAVNNMCLDTQSKCSKRMLLKSNMVKSC